MSRFVAVAAALALVVSGIAIGAFGTYLVLERPRGHQAPPPRPPGPFTREMEDQLNLSEDQKSRIQDILRKSHEETDAIRRELRPRLERNFEEIQARIAALLTADQRARFEELVRENRRSVERSFLEGPPPPPPPRPDHPGPPRDDRPPGDDPPPR